MVREPPGQRNTRRASFKKIFYSTLTQAVILIRSSSCPGCINATSPWVSVGVFAESWFCPYAFVCLFDLFIAVRKENPSKHREQVEENPT